MPVVAVFPRPEMQSTLTSTGTLNSARTMATPADQQPQLPPPQPQQQYQQHQMKPQQQQLRRAVYVHISDLTSAYNIDHARLEEELARVNKERASTPGPSSRGGGRGGAGRSGGVPTELDTSNFPQKRLQPPRGGYNLCVLVGSVEVVVDKHRVDGSRVRLAEVEVGDETGTVSLRARDSQIDALREISDAKGAVVLRNTTLEMYQGKHIRLAITKWGKLSTYPDDVASTPPPPSRMNKDRNFSLIDFSLVASELIPPQSDTFHQQQQQQQHPQQQEAEGQGTHQQHQTSSASAPRSQQQGTSAGHGRRGRGGGGRQARNKGGGGHAAAGSTGPGRHYQNASQGLPGSGIAYSYGYAGGEGMKTVQQPYSYHPHHSRQQQGAPAAAVAAAQHQMLLHQQYEMHHRHPMHHHHIHHHHQMYQQGSGAQQQQGTHQQADGQQQRALHHSSSAPMLAHGAPAGSFDGSFTGGGGGGGDMNAVPLLGSTPFVLPTVHGVAGSSTGNQPRGSIHRHPSMPSSLHDSPGKMNPQAATFDPAHGKGTGN